MYPDPNAALARPGAKRAQPRRRWASVSSEDVCPHVRPVYPPALLAERSLQRHLVVVSGGRRWWAHRESSRINIELTILPEKAEDVMELQGTVHSLACIR